MSKKVFYDDDARQRILGGAKILHDAVKTTLGPKGRNVVVSRPYSSPMVTKDGVTVAKSIELNDVDDETLGYKTGVELIKQAASKMNDAVGDGTTTITVLTYHILREANKLIAAGHNPLLLKKGLDLATKETIDNLKKLSEETDEEKLEQVATISASNSEIGKLVANVVSSVGKEGVVTVEASQGLETTSEIVEGYTFDRGFISPYMVTDQNRMEVVYNKPAIIITDRKISSMQEFLPILEKLVQAGRKEVVIIADDVDGEALSTLILNKIKGTFNSVAVRTPSFGDRKKEILQDLAIVTGSKVISEETGHDFSNADMNFIGSASKVVISKDETTIIEGAGDKDSVASRIEQINGQIASSKSNYDKENLEKRRASIEGKVAIIKVGGATETEIEEKKFRVDDAVAATKAAIADGVVVGGGTTLLQLSSLISEDDDSSVDTGKKLLATALEQPFRTLMENSGISPDKFIDVIQNGEYGYGIDVSGAQDIVNLKLAGIFDPTKVCEEAIITATSIAGTGMTMGALIVDVPEKEVPQPQMGMM